MSVGTWTGEKPADTTHRSLLHRVAYGPALILALAISSSGVLAAALLLSSIFEF